MERRSSDEDAIAYVGDLLDHAIDLTSRFLSDRSQLTASAAFVMNRVRREGPIRLTALAVKEGVSQPSMTQLVQRLERQGLLARLADPEDGRASLIAITGTGQRLLDERQQTRRERLAKLLETLSEGEQTALRQSARAAAPVLNQLVNNADSISDDAEAELSGTSDRFVTGR